MTYVKASVFESTLALEYMKTMNTFVNKPTKSVSFQINSFSKCLSTTKYIYTE